jgi:hypothetical protein
MESSSRQTGGGVRWKWRPAEWLDSVVPQCSCADCPRRSRLRTSFSGRVAGHSFESRWYCSPGCLQSILRLRLHSLFSGLAFDRARVHRFPIGLLLLNRGSISHPQLREALGQQREAGEGRLGEWLCRLSFITEQQLTAALAQQWGCPIYPLDRQPVQLSFGGLVPLKVLESACAVVAHVSADSAVAHLAFGDRLDFTTLYAVERMLDRRTIASVANQSSVERVLEHLRNANPSQDPTFDSVRDPAEMARIIGSYAGELQAVQVSVARAAAYIWVRFHRKHAARDLLFRIQPEAVSRPGAPKVLTDTVDRRKDGVPDADRPL